MWYALWTTVVIVLYAIAAVISKKVNETQSWNWVMVSYCVGLFGMWPIVAKYSKNLLFDRFLYDLCIMLGWYFTMIYLGAAKDFGSWQWLGMAMIFFGFIFLKIH